MLKLIFKQVFGKTSKITRVHIKTSTQLRVEAYLKMFSHKIKQNKKDIDIFIPFLEGFFGSVNYISEIKTKLPIGWPHKVL